MALRRSSRLQAHVTSSTGLKGLLLDARGTTNSSPPPQCVAPNAYQYLGTQATREPVCEEVGGTALHVQLSSANGTHGEGGSATTKAPQITRAAVSTAPHANPFVATVVAPVVGGQRHRARAGLYLSRLHRIEEGAAHSEAGESCGDDSDNDDTDGNDRTASYGTAGSKHAANGTAFGVDTGVWNGLSESRRLPLLSAGAQEVSVIDEPDGDEMGSFGGREMNGVDQLTDWGAGDNGTTGGRVPAVTQVGAHHAATGTRSRKDWDTQLAEHVAALNAYFAEVDATEVEVEVRVRAPAPKRLKPHFGTQLEWY